MAHSETSCTLVAYANFPYAGVHLSLPAVPAVFCDSEQVEKDA